MSTYFELLKYRENSIETCEKRGKNTFTLRVNTLLKHIEIRYLAMFRIIRIFLTGPYLTMTRK